MTAYGGVVFLRWVLQLVPILCVYVRVCVRVCWHLLTM